MSEQLPATPEFVLDPKTAATLELRLLTEASPEEATLVWKPSDRNPNGRYWTHRTFPLIQVSDHRKNKDLKVTLSAEEEAVLSATDDQNVLSMRICGHNDATRMTKVARLRDLCTPDTAEPMREDGRTVFSIPQHQFGVSVERFVFLITGVKQPRNGLDIRIQKLQLVRRADSKRTIRVYGRHCFSVEAATPASLSQTLSGSEELKKFQGMLSVAIADYLR